MVAELEAPQSVALIPSQRPGDLLHEAPANEMEVEENRGSWEPNRDYFGFAVTLAPCLPLSWYLLLIALSVLANVGVVLGPAPGADVSAWEDSSRPSSQTLGGNFVIRGNSWS